MQTIVMDSIKTFSLKKICVEFIEDPLNKHRTVANEIMMILGTSNIYNNKSLIKAPVQEIKLLYDGSCEEFEFPYLLPTGHFGFNVGMEV